ncbi:MAG: ACT domain-containing protein [Desulfobulbaceae bacterium]|nr:ACT domain-containing protein [Desulfobulbaceae bacterium]
MAGEKNIKKLLRSMSPKLDKDTFVFCSVKNGKYGDCAEAMPIASYMEEEGLTLVINKEVADRLGYVYEGVFKCITLEVYSSLESVGLTAAVSTKLCENNISANVFAGFYHDHIFVPLDMASEAYALLLDFCS